jgi:hypothetical protein
MDVTAGTIVHIPISAHPTANHMSGDDGSSGPIRSELNKPRATVLGKSQRQRMSSTIKAVEAAITAVNDESFALAASRNNDGAVRAT